MKIVAVTACTVGVAHTFMAAESLEKAALKTGSRRKKSQKQIAVSSR